MKNLTYLFILLIPAGLFAQTIDTAATLQQFDSLIQTAYGQAARGDFMNAQQTVKSGEELVLPIFGEKSTHFANTIGKKRVSTTFDGIKVIYLPLDYPSNQRNNMVYHHG